MTAARVMLALAGVVALSATLLAPVGAASSGWEHRDVGVDAGGSQDRDIDLALVDGGARVVFTRHPDSGGDDQGGGVHYGWCDTACDDPASWESVELDTSEVTWAEGYLNLVVDSQGRPRIAWMDHDDGSVKVAVCDSGCRDPAGWSTVAWPVGDTSTDDGGGTSIRRAVRVSMAIDPEGRLAVVHTDADEVRDLTYHSCRADCGSAASWSEVVLVSEEENGYQPSAPTLVFEGTRPRVVYTLLVDEDPWRLTFCESDCDDRSSWSRSVLGGEPDDADISAGSPHVGFDDGRAAIAYAVFDDHFHRDAYLAYLLCEADCTEGERWQQGPVFEDMREPAGFNDRFMPREDHYHSANPASLVLAGEAGARVSYRSCVNCGESDQEHRVFLAACDGACGDRASWSVERRDDFGWAHAPLLTRHPAGGYRLAFLQEPDDDSLDRDLHWAACETGCFDPPEPATTTSSTSTTSSSTTTTSTTSSSTTTTTAPPSDPDAPSAPTLVAPSPGSYPYGEPHSFEVRSESPEGQPYKAIVMVRDRDTGQVIADFETSLVPSGLTASAAPERPLPLARYEWTARAVDTLGRSSGFADAQPFTVRGG